MKVIFMGAPAFAVPTLKALSSLGSRIVAVYTKAPRQGGRRGLEIVKTPVHLTAEELGLSVKTPKTLRDPQARPIRHRDDLPPSGERDDGPCRGRPYHP